MQSDETLDCVGLMCPMPIVQLSKRMKTLAQGKVLAMRADDPGVGQDIPAWCNRTGNQLLGIEREGKVFVSYIRKSAP
jgi:TusA-related sulfurtransferase